MSRRWVIGSAAAALLFACSEFKDGDQAGPRDDGPSDASARSGDGAVGDAGQVQQDDRDANEPADGASTDATIDATNPADPYGALPTGYCCTADEQCRYRRCVEFAGSKTCADECFTNHGCVAQPGYVCVGATRFDPGRCEPSVATSACTPASEFRRGSKPTGACCVATGDGTSGLECQGGHCGSFGASPNPFICTHVCSRPADCGAAYQCLNVGDHGICAIRASTYTCQ